jgi:nucleoside-diphosphate-sugar epimerase
MLKILITGATGFIGTHLIKLLQGRHEIIILDRRRPITLPESSIEWLGVDLCKPLDYSKLPEKVDAVIHLAQSMFYRQFPDKAENIFDVNVHGTFHLLQYARHAKVESFIFASTGGVYGYGPKKFLETDPVNPSNFYGISKLASELLIRAYEPFIRSVIFRFFFVSGPGQEKMLIPGLWNKVKTGETLTIKGDSGLHINPIYVGDAVRVIDAALEPFVSGIFNVAGDEVVTIRELIGLVEQVVGKKASIKRMEDQEPVDLVGDNTRMKELLNVRPEIPLREGLRNMVREE